MHALTITRSVYGSGSLTATLLPNDLFKEIRTYLKSHLSLIHCLMPFVMLDLHGSYHFHASWVFFKSHTTHTHKIPDISVQVFVCGLCPTRPSGEGMQNHRPNRKSETQVTSLRGQMFISPGGIDMTP